MGAAAPPPVHNLEEIPVGVIEFKKIDQTILDKERERIYKSLPKNQYLCPKCGEVPELKNIYSENGYVELFCKNDKEIMLTAEDYLNNLSKSNLTYYSAKCIKCNKVQKEDKSKIFKYCPLCKKDFCDKCFNQKEGPHLPNHFARGIPINEKKITCYLSGHGKFVSFCQDHKMNLCKDLAENFHKGHQVTDFHKIKPDKKIIIEKNKMLANMIIFNEILLQTYEDFPDNYYHAKNVEILTKSIELENSRDKNELDKLLQKLNAENKKRMETLKQFKEKFGKELNGREKELSLDNLKIDNKITEDLFQINFYRLRDLDLSFNNIISINFIKKLNTLTIEIIKLGNNLIQDLGPLENIEFKKIIELDFKNNKVTDVSPLLSMKAETLKLLRIEENNLDHSLASFKKVIKKYTKKVNYMTMTYEVFNNKYKTNLSDKEKIIELSDLENGEDILKDLYFILDKNNGIEKLQIKKSGLDDLFYLEKIPFPKLKVLDLSYNNITSIQVFYKIKLENLKNLYLQNNKIQDISPLYSFQANLESLKLQNNKFNADTEENQSIFKGLEKRIKTMKYKEDE